MISRLTRTFGSLAVLVIAFRAYAWIAVPIIEPSASGRQQVTATPEQREKARGARSHERKQLERWFPPGSWELTAELVIELPQGKLFINEYVTLPENKLKLNPCSIVFLAPSKGDEAQRMREAVIVQVPGGAELEFDEPLDMKKFKVGNVVGGVLPGQFTIRSDQKQPGPADDLLIVARDAELKDNRVVSPHPIKFRLGPHYGSGRDVEIDLGKGAIGAKKEAGGLQLEGIKSFTIKREVIAFLDAGKGSLLGGLQRAIPTPEAPSKQPLVNAIPRTSGPPVASTLGPPEELPLRIACQGPFRFDMAGLEASFEDRVDVLRLNDGGQSDRLQCQRLSLFFTRKPSPGQPPSPDNKASSLGRLLAERFEAYGQPVTVESPAEDIEAVGEILRYNLITKEASLEGEHPVMLRRGPNKITAPRVEFQPVPGRRFGKFSATGPGRFDGVEPEEEGVARKASPRKFAASWTQQLSFGPDGSDDLFSLRGDARIEMIGFGGLGADEIHVWLYERPKTAGLPGSHFAARAPSPGMKFDQQAFLPQKMMAKGNVRLDAVQLLGRVDEMQIWFKPAPLAMGTLPDGSPVEELPAPPGATPTAEPSLFGDSRPQSRQRFNVSGSLLQAEVLVGPARPQLGKLRIHEKAKVVETQTQNPGERPFVIAGHDIDYEQTDPTRGVLVVSGAPAPGKPNEITPAHIEGRGLTLDGGTIRLDRGENTLVIDGPGAMTVPADRDLEGRTVARPQPLSVRWQRGLAFDGIAAHFAGSVICDFDNHQLRTEQLDVNFQERVNFASTPDQKRPELATIACRGSVVMNGRTYSDGELTSIEQMQAFDLTFDRLTGAIHADGPGEMTMVRRGSFQLGGQDPAQPTNGSPGDKRSPPQGLPVQAISNSDRTGSGISEDLPVPPPSSVSAPPAVGLTYIHVEFPRELRGTVPPPGDLRPRVVEFSERVKMTFGPVASWQETIDADDFDRQLATGDAGAQGAIFLNSRVLTVTELPAGATPRSVEVDAPNNVEIEASGNVEIEGINFEEQNFFARADRLSYAAAKDLMILQGDGRTPADLARQNPYWTGAGEKIFYWPKSKRFKVQGAQSGDITLPAGS